MNVFMVRLSKKSGPLSEDGGDDDLAWHKAIAKALSVLDKLAMQAKLKPLSAFLSEDPDNIYDTVDDEDEAEELLAKLPPVQWFNPDSALPTVKALIALVENKGEDSKNAANVVSELNDVMAILEFAISKKAKFRFYRQF